MISVIIPCYDHAWALGDCLRSVFAQTEKDLEVIVIDDGSTDDLDSALAPWKDRLRFFRQINMGGPSARNRGFKESQGDLVIFCDADVILRPDAFAKLRSALETHPASAYAYGSFRFGWKRFGLRAFDAAALKRENFIHTTSLIRRNAFPGFDETLKRFQDWDLWLTMEERGARGVWVPEELFRVQASPGRISQWLPKFLHRVPWKRLHWRPTAVASYDAAADIIKKKHHLP